MLSTPPPRCEGDRTAYYPNFPSSFLILPFLTSFFIRFLHPFFYTLSLKLSTLLFFFITNIPYKPLKFFSPLLKILIHIYNMSLASKPLLPLVVYTIESFQIIKKPPILSVASFLILCISKSILNLYPYQIRTHIILRIQCRIRSKVICYRGFYKHMRISSIYLYILTHIT